MIFAVLMAPEQSWCVVGRYSGENGRVNFRFSVFLGSHLFDHETARHRLVAGAAKLCPHVENSLGIEPATEWTPLDLQVRAVLLIRGSQEAQYLFNFFGFQRHGKSLSLEE